jgi:uncharacterized protein (TIGR02118 family)
MVKVMVLYGPPSDAGAFEDYYANTHLPLAAKMPGVQKLEAGKVIGTPDGQPAPYYRVAEVYFDSPEDMQQSLGSPEGQATVEDIGKFATGGATVMVAEL